MKISQIICTLAWVFSIASNVRISLAYTNFAPQRVMTLGKLTQRIDSIVSPDYRLEFYYHEGENNLNIYIDSISNNGNMISYSYQYKNGKLSYYSIGDEESQYSFSQRYDYTGKIISQNTESGWSGSYYSKQVNYDYKGDILVEIDSIENYENTSVYHFLKKYDTAGNIIYNSSTYEDIWTGSLSGECTTYSYDNDSRLLEIVFYNIYEYDIKEPIEKIKYTYQNGQISQETHYTYYGGNYVEDLRSFFDSQTSATTSYQFSWGDWEEITSKPEPDILYDANENLLYQKKYKWNGSRWYVSSFDVEYTYDNHNNITSMSTNNGNYTWSYDDANKCIQSAYYYNSILIREKIYDSKGNLISNQTSSTEKTVFTYNDINQCIKEMTYSKSSASSTWTLLYDYDYDYDASGNMIAKTRANNKKETWVYDTFGNCIEHQIYIWNNKSWKRSFKETFEYDTSVKGSDIWGLDCPSKLISKTTYESLGNYRTVFHYDKLDMPEVSPIRKISDGQTITNSPGDGCNITYSRTFKNTEWQALYVPFSIPIDTLTAYGLEVAELNDTHMYDNDEDGVYEKIAVEFLKLTQGATSANLPYLIKASKVGSVDFSLLDWEMMPTEAKSIDCSTTKQLFTFTGTYSGIDGATMHDNHYYAISGGKLMQAIDSSVGLKPQRWYMKIENRDGSPMKYDAPGSKAPAIRIIVNGEQIEEFEETATSVEYVSEESGNDDYFTLDGQQIRKISRPGLYIKNGKKVIFK